MRIRSYFSVIVLGGLIPTVLQADPLPKQFTLGRYVPADCWMYIHGVDNPDRHWIEQKWADVFQTLLDSGVDKDVKKLVLSILPMPPDQRSRIEERLGRAFELVKKVRWGDLVRHEIVFAERMGSHGMAYDYMFLARGAEGSGTENFKALGAILDEAANATEKLTVLRSEKRNVELLSFGFPSETSANVTELLWVFRKGDMIGVVFSPPIHGQSGALLNTTLALMAGDETEKCVNDSPRFREAISRVKRPVDVVSFFDFRMLFSDLGNMFDTLAKELVKSRENARRAYERTEAQGAAKEIKVGNENDRRGIRMVRKLLEYADAMDYSIVTESTRNDRLFTDEVTRLRPGKQDTPFAKMLMDRTPFERFDKYIPKKAKSFSLSTGVDIQRLYNLVVDFVRDDVPEGDKLIEKWNGLLASLDFDPERDLFSWYSGEMISVSLPAAIVTPMGGSDSVLMIRVKNPEIARCKVNAAVDFVSAKAREHGQTLMVSPAKCKEGGFREVTHPMLAMIARPVIGVQGDWLVLSTSAGAVDKCMRVAAGEAPSIKEAPRFKREGLVPDRPVCSMSFEDLSKQGQEMAGVAAGVGMMGGMIAGMLPPEVPPEAREMLQNVMGIIMKLAPVLQKIDFYNSKSSVGFVEDELTHRSRSVLTYKRNPPPPDRPAEHVSAPAN